MNLISNNPLVSIIMGSDSDWNTMELAAQTLNQFDVPYEVEVVSAHRTPDKMMTYGKGFSGRGIKVVIAGAGGAAHLPGMIASLTDLPVIGVPVALKNLEGLDSLYSIVQMPTGIPVATVAIGNSANAALLAIRILAIENEDLTKRLQEYREGLKSSVEQKNKNLKNKIEKGKE